MTAHTDAVEQARDMLAKRGRFPSGGTVPFDVALNLIAAALITPAAVPGSAEMREAVARMLDPVQWQDADSYRKRADEWFAKGHTNDNDPLVAGYRETAISITQRSLDKADAILALITPDRERIRAEALPDIGPDPMRTDGGRDGWEDRLKEAYVLQQKGVPDQCALVWRYDIGQARNALITARNRVALASKERGDG